MRKKQIATAADFGSKGDKGSAADKAATGYAIQPLLHIAPDELWRSREEQHLDRRMRVHIDFEVEGSSDSLGSRRDLHFCVLLAASGKVQNAGGTCCKLCAPT